MQTNLHWGVLENDVVGGSVSPAFGNMWIGNTIAGNGTANQALYGAFATCLTTGTRIESTYFEAQQRGVVVGCVSGDPGISTPSGYTSQFGGNTVNVHVDYNFMNDSGNTTDPTTNAANNTAEVELMHTISASINYNSKIGTANCLVDGGALGVITILNDQVNSGTGITTTCLNGALGAGGLNNFVQYGDGPLGAMHFGGAVQVDGVLTTSSLTRLNNAFPTMDSTARIVLIVAGITVWQSTTVPGGTCGGPLGMNIWFTPTNMYVCSGTWKAVTIV
jgi:hypothetical protein